jgi:hypothetical protein
MWRFVGVIAVCTLAGCALGYLFGLAIDSISPGFGDRLLGTNDITTPGIEHTSGLNLALGLANGAWMGFVAGLAAVLLDTFLKARQISAGAKPSP